MFRKDAIENIMENIEDELIVCNIGVPCKELYAVKDRAQNFYMIGSMGLASSIGLGIAKSRPEKEIVIIDGDGSLLMNLGSLVTVFAQNPENFTWIVINNGAYGSTGNQDTYAQKVDLLEVAKGIGFEDAHNYEDIDLKEVIHNGKCSFINYNVEAGNSVAPNIDLSPEEIKERFMKELNL